MSFDGGRRWAPAPAPRQGPATRQGAFSGARAVSDESSRRQSSALRGVRSSAGASRGATGGGGGGGAFDPSSYVLGELLGMYNSEGSYVGGTPGYTISRANERAAARGGYDRAEANRKSNYADIDALVRGRNPEIRKGYSDASASLSENAKKRALETRAALMAREQDAARAAAEMGLTVNPGATARAGEVAEGGIARANTNAGAWEGFNSGSAERAVERNEAVGDTFRWEGTQQAAALSNMLMQMLAGLQDQYVAGSAGRMVGGLSDSEKFRALGMIDKIGNNTFKQELDTTKMLRSGGGSGGQRSSSGRTNRPSGGGTF